MSAISRAAKRCCPRHADGDAPRRCRDRSAAVGETAEARRARACPSTAPRKCSVGCRARRRGRGDRAGVRGAAFACGSKSPVAVTRGDRFILRSASPPMTIAGGRILDPDPAWRRRAPSTLRRGSQALAAEAADDLAARCAMVIDRGAKGLAVAELVLAWRRRAHRREATATRDSSASADRALARSPGRGGRSSDALSDAPACARRAGLHKRDPLAEGLPREEARERLLRARTRHVFERVLSAPARRIGTLIVRDRLALPRHRAGSRQTTSARELTLETGLSRRRGLTPPDPAAVAAGLDLRSCCACWS